MCLLVTYSGTGYLLVAYWLFTGYLLVITSLVATYWLLTSYSLVTYWLLVTLNIVEDHLLLDGTINFVTFTLKFHLQVMMHFEIPVAKSFCY